MSVFNTDFIVVYIRVMQGCNLDCDHCFTLGTEDDRMVTEIGLIDDYLKAIKQNINPKKVTFYIHGGETFLAPLDYLRDVNDLITKYFKEAKIDIIPQTNLTFKIDQEFIDLIKIQYSSTIGVSWDADIRFDDTRQSDLFFKNLNTLLDNNIKVHIAITAQKYLLNHDPLKIIKQFEGVDSIDFELLTVFNDKTKNLKPNNLAWAEWFDKVVDYYQHNETTWCLPQIDLFVKSILGGMIYDCKCNCCDKRTFTLNPNGTVGFCPDLTYVQPITTVAEMKSDWAAVEAKGLDVVINKLYDSEKHEMCYTCEHYDICGGNCESALFDETNECPLSKKSISRIKDNIETFKVLYENKALRNLTELRENYDNT